MITGMIGFNDLKTIEMLEFIQSISQGNAIGPDFKEAFEIQKLVDAAVASSRERSWISI